MNEPSGLRNLRKKPALVRGIRLTADNGPEVAAWCGGRWHPEGIITPQERRHPLPDELLRPAIWMPSDTAGRPVAFAERDGYGGDTVIQGLAGEFYIATVTVAALAYEDPADDVPV